MKTKHFKDNKSYFSFVRKNGYKINIVFVRPTNKKIEVKYQTLTQD